MKVFRRKVGFITCACPRRPFVPLGSSRQEASDGIGELAGIIWIHSQTGLGWIHDLAAGVEVADKARPPDAHCFEVHEAKAFAVARHRETTALPKQMLL